MQLALRNGISLCYANTHCADRRAITEKTW